MKEDKKAEEQAERRKREGKEEGNMTDNKKAMKEKENVSLEPKTKVDRQVDRTVLRNGHQLYIHSC